MWYQRSSFDTISLSIMHNNTIAAISLFGEYRRDKKDVHDIIADFIKAAISIKREPSYTPAIMKDYLLELFGIDIPTSVIKSVFKNKIKEAKSENSTYTISNFPDNNIENRICSLRKTYDSILDTLKSYIQEVAPAVMQTYPTLTIESEFTAFLMDEKVASDLYELFSAFLVNNRINQDYYNKFSAGMIAYSGLKYIGNTGSVGSWKEKLVVYLDTEFLFHCAGYNDKYYQLVFDELHSLIVEINSKCKPGEQPIVELRYLQDTKEVFDRFFRAAKEHVESGLAPDPSKKAFVKIITESTTVFDVDAHKANVLKAIRAKGILLDDKDHTDKVVNPSYVIFGADDLDNLREKLKTEYNGTTETKLDYYVRVMTIIYGLRQGIDYPAFENCRYVFLSGSRFARTISYYFSTQFQRKIPIITDIDFLISRMWFKLNKTLSSNSIPVSLDVVARSHAALSEEVCIKAKQLYEELKSKKYTKEQQEVIYDDLRRVTSESLIYDENSLVEVLAFCSYGSTDEILQAHHDLKQKARDAERKEHEIEALKSELGETQNEIIMLRSVIEAFSRQNLERRKLERAEKKKKWHRRFVLHYIICVILYCVCFVLLLGCVGYLAYSCFGNEPLLSIISDVLAVALYVFAGHKRIYHKIINKNKIYRRTYLH